MRHLPNLLSMLRVVAVIRLLWLAWQARPLAFLVLLLAAVVSDALDGWLARRRDGRRAAGRPRLRPGLRAGHRPPAAQPGHGRARHGRRGCRVHEARIRTISTEAAFTPFFALTERDRSRLAYRAEIELTEAQPGRLPIAAPVEVSFPGLAGAEGT